MRDTFASWPWGAGAQLDDRRHEILTCFVRGFIRFYFRFRNAAEGYPWLCLHEPGCVDVDTAPTFYLNYGRSCLSCVAAFCSPSCRAWRPLHHWKSAVRFIPTCIWFWLYSRLPFWFFLTRVIYNFFLFSASIPQTVVKLWRFRILPQSNEQHKRETAGQPHRTDGEPYARFKPPFSRLVFHLVELFIRKWT